MSAAACLVIATTAGVAVATNIIGSRVVEDLVNRRFETVARSTASQVSELVGIAVNALRGQRQEAMRGLLALEDSVALGRQFAERVRPTKRVAWISYGDAVHDRFIGATRRPDGAIGINISDPAVNGGRPEEMVVQPDGSLLTVTSQAKAAYTLAGQPWFVEAMKSDKVIVTGPYRFAEGRTGLTLSVRWTDPLGTARGVFTVDFLIEDISEKLADLIGEGGDAVLLDGKGGLLANAGALRPPDLVETARTAFAAHRPAMQPANGEEKSLIVDVAASGGRDHQRVSMIPIDVGLESEWVLVVVDSYEDLFAPLRRLHATIAAISAVVVLAGLAGAWMLATSLSRPMHALSAEAERIRNFELNEPITARSNIVEVASLIESMKAMKEGLRSFGRFVPKRVVKRLIAAGGAARLGGERSELTLLFSDIAGFTSMSERMDPEQVMQRISRYFDVMSEAIHGNQGVVDKYVGDAIMAIWNAPRRDDSHAANACRALLACMRANDALDLQAARDGEPPLPTRFGLHTGEAIIGNIGSADRMQYTAIGANVNLAARLEPLNKRYGTRNLVSAETRIRARERFLFRSVAIVQPAGTSQPIEVFELLGSVEDAEAEAIRTRIARWQEAMARLRAGRPAEALPLFEAIAAEPTQTGAGDSLAGYYVMRCAEAARAAAAGTPWDGVDMFGEK
jgi:adenylate cyclase